MNEHEQIIQNIIDDLAGSCKSIDEVCQYYNLDYDDLSMKDLCDIDEQIFCCDHCGWWYETSESHDWRGDNICDSCYEDVSEGDVD